MNATSVTTPSAPSRSATAWKVILILIPFVTLALLLWLRQLEVSALRQRAVPSYGTVPPFQRFLEALRRPAFLRAFAFVVSAFEVRARSARCERS